MTNITVNGTYEASDGEDFLINVSGGSDVTIVAPTGNDGVEKIVIDYGDDDSVSDIVRIDLSTFDQNNLLIEVENYDPTDKITIEGAFNTYVDPGDPDFYTFDYIGENGNTYSGAIRVKDGGEQDFTADQSPIIICYAPGTMIDTPDGPRAVETLQPGDLVLTADHAAQPIKWVRASEQPLDGLPLDARPVLIRAGALGPGRPARNLVVSPQHRILIGGRDQLIGVCMNEVFAPAKALTTLPGIRFMRGQRAITWIHFVCAAHEVVLANGCYSESLLLGPMALSGMTAKDRNEMSQIFGSPNEDQPLNGAPARPCLKAGEVKRLLADPKALAA